MDSSRFPTAGPHPSGAGRLRRLPLLVAAVLLLAACSVQQSSATPPGGPATAATGAGPGDAAGDPSWPPPPTDVALMVARDFATEWAHPERTTDAWWKAVTVNCEPGFAEQLRSVDPRNVPATRITGSAQLIRRSGDLLTVEVPTDAGTLTVQIASIGGKWLVSGNGFARDR